MDLQINGTKKSLEVHSLLISNKDITYKNAK